MKTRIIHTRFWQDSFVLNLSQNARLLFIYILTNERLGLVGAYECPDQFIMLETGLNSGQLEKAKIELGGKVLFEEGWVALKNATKYNNYSSNEVHRNAYEKELDSLPENVKKFVLDKEYLCTSPRLDKIHNTKIINNKTEIINTKELVSENEKQEIVDLLSAKGMEKEFALQEINKFISYWSELNHSGTKQRWQLEKTFEVKRRLGTWFNNIKKFSGRGNDRVVIG